MNEAFKSIEMMFGTTDDGTVIFEFAINDNEHIFFKGTTPDEIITVCGVAMNVLSILSRCAETTCNVAKIHNELFKEKARIDDECLSQSEIT